MDRLENLMDIDQVEAPEDSEDEDEDDVGPSEESINLVASQTNVSAREAEEALRAENNEVVNAIMVIKKIANVFYPVAYLLTFL
jgi:NACalpha-BTF3-like transcription factor